MDLILSHRAEAGEEGAERVEQEVERGAHRDVLVVGGLERVEGARVRVEIDQVGARGALRGRLQTREQRAQRARRDGRLEGRARQMQRGQRRARGRAGGRHGGWG